MSLAGIDHVMIVTPDLAASAAEFEAMGFTVAPRARHARWGTANHLCVLEDAYIELLGLDPGAAPGLKPSGSISATLAAGGGLPMVALASENPDELAARLRAGGFEPDEPLTWSRDADTPSGRTTATFTTFMLPVGSVPGFDFFCCRQHTRHAIWCREWMDHPNRARRLLGLVRELDGSYPEAADAYRRLAGDGQVLASADGLEISIGTHRIVLRDRQAHARTVVRLACDAPGPTRRQKLSSVPGVEIEFLPEPR
jgi:catechol 2,3-dioxygenase-like lactoylglutathione lyase family enzyme